MLNLNTKNLISLNVNWLSPEIRYMVFSGTKQTLVYDDTSKIIV